MMDAYKYLLNQDDFNIYKVISANLDFLKKVQPFIKEAQDFDLKQAIGYPMFFDLLKNYGSEDLVLDYSGLINGPFVIGDILTTDNGASGKLKTDSGTKLTLTGLSEASRNMFYSASKITGTTGSPNNPVADVSNAEYGAYYVLMNGSTYQDQLQLNVRFEGLRASLVYWTFARFLERGNDYSTATGFVVKLTPESQPLSRLEIADKITQAKSGAYSYWLEVEKFLYDMHVLQPTMFPLFVKSFPSKRKRGGAIRITSINKFADENTVGYTKRLSSGCSCGLGCVPGTGCLI